MSIDQTERGAFKLPIKEYASFKKALWNELNAYQQTKIEATNELFTAVAQQYKINREAKTLPKHEFEWSRWVDEIRNRVSKKGARYNGYGMYGVGSYSALSHWDWQDIVDKFIIVSDNKVQPKKANKKDFPTVKLSELEYSDDFCSIYFDDKTKTVHWSVPENNHACDHAHEQHMAKFLFKQLQQVKWGRGTGGKVLYTDEYLRDDALDYEGFLASRVTFRAGSLGESDLKLQGRRRPK